MKAGLLGIGRWGWLLMVSLPCLLWGQPTEPDVFGYQRSERNMLKIDLVGLLQDRVHGVLYGQARLGYEHKVSPAWSFLVEGVSDIYYGRVVGRPDPAYTVTMEPRNYLFQAHQVGAGHRASNFSGNYVTISTSVRLRAPRLPGQPELGAAYLYPDRLAFAPLFGVQRRILRWGFADFRMGLEGRYQRLVATGSDPGGHWQMGPVARLRIGLAL
ncbi:MAG: hypothetical protein D6722_06985 [Bacteroidetes bacterium]|nr:MAG: hypothetical protein D6722_06985 [Bacteroidota bacterium]